MIVVLPTTEGAETRELGLIRLELARRRPKSLESKEDMGSKGGVFRLCTSLNGQPVAIPAMELKASTPTLLLPTGRLGA